MIFFIPPCIRRPRLRGRRQNIAIPFGVGKLKWWGYPTVRKLLRILCNRLDSIPACDGRTDILSRHSPRYAYASRGKNRTAKINIVPRFQLDTYGRRTFAVAGPTMWNLFQHNLREPDMQMDCFRRIHWRRFFLISTRHIERIRGVFATMRYINWHLHYIYITLCV